MDMQQNSGHPLIGVPLLFLTGLGEYIRHLSEDASIQDWASAVSITAGSLAIIHYLFLWGAKAVRLYKNYKLKRTK